MVKPTPATGHGAPFRLYIDDPPHPAFRRVGFFVSESDDVQALALDQSPLFQSRQDHLGQSCLIRFRQARQALRRYLQFFDHVSILPHTIAGGKSGRQCPHVPVARRRCRAAW